MICFYKPNKNLPRNITQKEVAIATTTAPSTIAVLKNKPVAVVPNLSTKYINKMVVIVIRLLSMDDIDKHTNNTTQQQ